MGRCYRYTLGRSKHRDSYRPVKLPVYLAPSPLHPPLPNPQGQAASEQYLRLPVFGFLFGELKPEYRLFNMSLWGRDVCRDGQGAPGLAVRLSARKTVGIFLVEKALAFLPRDANAFSTTFMLLCKCVVVDFCVGLQA